MLTVVADTHGRTDHRLAGRTLEAVREADLVLHAGDLTTEAVLEAFEAEAAAVLAVRGNNDPDLAALPLERVLEYEGVRIALVHGHRHAGAGTGAYAREVDADLLVVGHSHDPGFADRDPVPRLNPGSHARPRWYRPAHAELTPAPGGLEGRLVEPDGTTFETFTVGAASSGG